MNFYNIIKNTDDVTKEKEIEQCKRRLKRYSDKLKEYKNIIPNEESLEYNKGYDHGYWTAMDSITADLLDDLERE
jgi:hypothetical protein